jgi:hypothetical protein
MRPIRWCILYAEKYGNYAAKWLICKYRTPGCSSSKGREDILDLDKHGKHNLPPCLKILQLVPNIRTCLIFTELSVSESYLSLLCLTAYLFFHAVH